MLHVARWIGILRTAELHPGSDSKADAILERARVGDALVNIEAHLLLDVRVVREHLLGEPNRSRGDNPALVELVFDLVDLHVLPQKVEELVCGEISRAVVRERGVLGHTRVQGIAGRGRDQTKVARVLARSGLNLEPAADERRESGPELRPMTKSWGSLVFIVPIAVDVTHGRLLFAGKKDLAGYLAFDRIQPCVLPCAVEEREPLIRVVSVRDTVVPDLGFSIGARENGTLAGVTDDAETEALWWNENRHLLRVRLRDEMRRDAADEWGPSPYLYRSSPDCATHSAVAAFPSDVVHFSFSLQCEVQMDRGTIHSKSRAWNTKDFGPFEKVWAWDRRLMWGSPQPRASTVC